jgi:hypothetical protein
MMINNIKFPINVKVTTKKAFYNSEILTEKLDIWVSEAPERETQDRLTAKSRILDAYNRNLDTLNLNGLYLTNLPVGVFNALINLYGLELSDNQLSVLPDGVFSGLNRLRWLSLSNNLLTTLNADIFNGLTELFDLNLTGNRLITLSDGLFNDLTWLRRLHLSNNHLVSLPDNIFTDLVNLEVLDLYHNQLGVLQDRLFNGLTELRELRLSHNQLSALPIEIFNGLIKLREVRLENNRFNREVVNQIRNSFHNSNVEIEISAYEPRSMRPIRHPIRHNLTIVDRLNEILKEAKSNYQLKLDWDQLVQRDIFNAFLKKIPQMSDVKNGSKAQAAAVYGNLATIIMAMDENPELREICFNIARESTQTCGDRVAFGFIQMQLQVKLHKLHKPNSSLSELIPHQKAMCALEIIFEIAGAKAKSTTGVIDEIEVYLTYIKHLKDYLQVEITDMLYESLSDIKQDDINAARERLNKTLTDDYVYAALADSDIAKKRYASEFEAIQSQLEFDVEPKNGESDGAYQERMKNLENSFKEAKVNFLKQQLKNDKQVLESLPPLVDGD